MAGIRLAIPLRLITVRREHRLQALHPGLSALLRSPLELCSLEPYWGYLERFPQTPVLNGPDRILPTTSPGQASVPAS